MKNLLQIVSEDGSRLFLVITLVPYKICQLDTRTGVCQLVDMNEQDAAQAEVRPLNPTPFAASQHGWGGRVNDGRASEICDCAGCYVRPGRVPIPC